MCKVMGPMENTNISESESFFSDIFKSDSGKKDDSVVKLVNRMDENPILVSVINLM